MERDRGEEYDVLPEDLSYPRLIQKHSNMCGPGCTLYTAITKRDGLCVETGVVFKGDSCRLENMLFKGD